MKWQNIVQWQYIVKEVHPVYYSVCVEKIHKKNKQTNRKYHDFLVL